MILYLDTTADDKIELMLWDSTRQLQFQSTKGFSAAEEFSGVIQEFLAQNHVSSADLQKIAVKVGSGWFSHIRLGIVAANALAYSLGIKIVPVGKVGDWSALSQIEGVAMLSPQYDAEPNITKPKNPFK